MSYVNKIISMNSTEKDFMKAFINELTTADSRIVCETDIDAEFENEDTSHKVTIILNVNNCYKLKIARESYLSSNTNHYNIYQTINGTDNAAHELFICFYLVNILDVTTRALRFKVISNDNAIELMFGSYDSESYIYNVFSYHEQGFNLVSKIKDTSSMESPATKAELVRTDENALGECYKIANRLVYTRECEDVEIIESKALLKNNIATHDMKNVFDCSNVIANSILLIDNNKYFAVDSNTLIKI